MTGKARECVAGHPPALLYRAADVSTARITHSSLPVGVVAGFEYAETEIQLYPGDRMVLYSDGLSEARREQEFLGTEGIERILAESGRETPETLVDRFIEIGKQWIGDGFADDVAVIVISYEP